MPKEKVIYSLPVRVETKSFETLKNQIEECLRIIEKSLSDNRQETPVVLKQTVFLRASDNEEFNAWKKEVSAVLKEYYGTGYPPTSYIGEPPAEGALIAIELTLLAHRDESITVIPKDLEGIRYITVTGPGTREIYAAGLASEENTAGTHRQAEEAFSHMSRVLQNEGMNFSQIVRQWNYIENITGLQPNGDGVRQNYQAFNDVRSKNYSRAEFDRGYPAATGIGMDNGGVVVEFIAVEVTDDKKIKGKIVPVKNPDQVDAHRYSQEYLVGRSINGKLPKTTPKFERAKVVRMDTGDTEGYVVYISGTASIQGQKVVAPEDVEEQTRITIANIDKLVSRENIENHGLTLAAPAETHKRNYSHIRVYVKKESDTPAVKAICQKKYKNVPTIYLVSDICRDNLLVEIEGAMQVTAQGDMIVPPAALRGASGGQGEAPPGPPISLRER